MHYPYCLHINRLRLSVFLGVSEEERAVPQSVDVDIRIYFSQTPDGFDSDNGQYICYDNMCQTIIERVTADSFLLIEYLTSCIYEAVKEYIASVNAQIDCKTCLHIHKCNPPVAYQVAESGFSYSDLGADDTVIAVIGTA